MECTELTQPGIEPHYKLVTVHSTSYSEDVFSLTTINTLVFDSEFIKQKADIFDTRSSFPLAFFCFCSYFIQLWNFIE